jgi:hypothetical protein
MTCYVVPVGESTMFPRVVNPGSFHGEGTLTFKDVVDGTSNTIMILQVPERRAVIWSKPDDWELDPDDFNAFFREQQQVFAAGAESSCRRFKRPQPTETIQRMFGRNDRLPYEILYK